MSATCGGLQGVGRGLRSNIRVCSDAEQINESDTPDGQRRTFFVRGPRECAPLTGGQLRVNVYCWRMASKRKVTPEEQLETVIARARVELETKGVAAGAKLGAAASRPQVVARLCSEGFEPTAKGLRVRLDVQGERLLAQGKPLSLSEFAKRLKGAKAVEAKELAVQLRREGKAHLVLRGKSSYLVPCGETVLRRDELEGAVKRLKGAAAKLVATAAWLDKARKDQQELTVLKSELYSEIAAVSAMIAQPGALTGASAADVGDAKRARAPVVASDHAGAAPLELGVALRGAILALRDEDSRLASIPQVSLRLRERATAQAVKDALLAEHRRGRVQLRPEGGIGRLSEEERALCPTGAGGVPLSWVSLLEE